MQPATPLHNGRWGADNTLASDLTPTLSHNTPPPTPSYALMGGPEGTVVLFSAFTAGGAPCILAAA